MNVGSGGIKGWRGVRTPELALVVAATAWPWNDERSHAAQDLAGRVADWPRVIDLVDRHRVAGLALHGLTAGDVPIPADFRAALSSRARKEAMGELQAAAETARLCKSFRAAGVAHLVLKGPTIALAAYGRFGVRSSIDIDLLVRKEQLAETQAVLASAGYVRTEPTPDASPSEVRARLGRYKDFVFVHSVTGIVVELHWRLFTNPHLLREDPWAGTASTSLMGDVDVPVLKPDMFLLHLCVHGAEHGWMRLKWLADLATFLARSDDAPANFHKLAKEKGIRRLAGPGILLCHILYGTGLPPGLLREFETDWRMRALFRISAESLIGAEDGVELDDHGYAATLKNLSHYLFSSHPAFWLSEFRFDLLDRPEEASGAGAISRRLGRLRRLAVERLSRR